MAKHKAQIPAKESDSKRAEFKPKAKDEERARGDQAPGKSSTAKRPAKKQYPKGNSKTPVVEKVKYNFGKNKKS